MTKMLTLDELRAMMDASLLEHAREACDKIEQRAFAAMLRDAAYKDAAWEVSPDVGQLLLTERPGG